MPTQKEIPEWLRSELQRPGKQPCGELATRAGISKSTLSKWRNIILAENIYGFPPPEGKVYPEEELRLEGDWVVTSDWHLPYYDQRLANSMVSLTKAMEITNILIVGDFFDIKWLSQFDIRDLEGSLRDDLAVGIRVLESLLKNFSNIVWLMGNHEARLFRILKWQLNLPDLIKFLTADERVKGSTQAHAWLTSGGKLFRLTHPKSYSRNAAQIAGQLSEKYHCSVLSAHGHLMGLKFSLSGEYLGGDLGGMFDEKRQEYLYLEGDTSHPHWISGFWIIRHGYATMFPNHTTDWDALLKTRP